MLISMEIKNGLLIFSYYRLLYLTFRMLVNEKAHARAGWVGKKSMAGYAAGRWGKEGGGWKERHL